MKLSRTIHLAIGAGSLATALLAASPASADYPIVSQRYLADPGSVVYDGRIYLYNSNDDDNNGGYSMHSVVCVSTADLKNWTDHGVVFQVPKDASWANNSWAPQPITRDGTIFLYFGNSTAGVGVASSTNPAGHFKDAKGGYLVNSSTPGAKGTDQWLFDPGAFIDEDGQAYLSFGGNGENNARIIKLGSDLASVSGSAVSLSPKNFFEASFLFKRNKIYYFAYSTTGATGQKIDYLMSDNPMTGWKYAGTIGPQPPSNSNNNHASEFEFKGQWYHAFHNRIVAKNAGIDPGVKRNLGIEVLNFKDTGEAIPVTYTTDGVPQVGNLNPYVRVEAETTNAQSGIETDTCGEACMFVTSINDGDWIKVRGVDFGTAGAKTFTARVASTSAGGAIEVRLGGATGTLVATCSVPSTGGAQTWGTATCPVTGATGVKDVTFKFTGGNFNFDSWQFTGGDGPVAGAGGNGSGGSGSGGSGSSGGTSGSGGSGGSGGTGGAAGAPAADAGVRDSSTGGAAGSGAGGAGGDARVDARVDTRGGTIADAGGAGSSATGGAAGSAGTGGVGGSVATGGTTAGGSGGASVGGSAAPSTNGDSGCSCRLGRASASGMTLALPLVLFVLALRRRRTP